ncbi:hypothetical protein GcM1_215035 [Golovinomyces cichoracearum]|uniref:Phosphoglycerate mutase family protein n=1 Tax=Golovinomyces cichoracearum TaxID=62708 RepID=A0A420ITU6_9PEZI|nr:hypothetical protein GcM1_215035 [Golovinomyces cichoracearum]
MGNPPAVIIVVRHGARLDAADPKWHLTSATPYDPPLTYGGWSQSKALGARIANILHNRENVEENSNSNAGFFGTKYRGKRRHKFVIHTSPFQRCIQTSIAISAGIAQNLHHHHSSPSKHGIDPYENKHMIFSLMQHTVMGSTGLTSIPEPAAASEKTKLVEQPQQIKRSTIRVDAFLGEWLTPDYFEFITPPPSSVMMVASAKSDLLRREDYSLLTQTKDSKANRPFPGGWGNSVASGNLRDSLEKKDEEGPLSSMSCLNTALPHREPKNNRERTSSLISSGSHGSRHRGTGQQVDTPGAQDAHGVYQPPVPSYAISHSDPIPAGYVSHARDACIEVDYQWDSMREPHNWGKGGEYGEEWSSMHKRFRAGLQNLVLWYQKSDGLSKNINRNRSNSLGIISPEVEADNEDTDLVVILVTHGAGCNALIGALTNQPVLLDVGMASLTMAVQKPTLTSLETSGSHSFTSEYNLSLSEYYDVKLIANSEHLRSSTSSTPSTSRAPSVSGLSGGGDRIGSIDNSDINRPRPLNSCLGSIRRASSMTGNKGARPYVPPRFNSTGLWSAPRYCEEVEEDNIILNFGSSDTHHNEETKNSSQNNTSLSFPSASAKKNENNDSDDSKSGDLWGNLKTSNNTGNIRDLGQKRRWTVDDRESLLGFGQIS